MIGQLLVTTLAVLANAPSAAPGVAGDSVVVLPEVRVERQRPSDALRRVPSAFVTTLEARRDTRAVQSLTDMLVESAGVHVLQYGGLGSFSTVSLRGAPAGHVSVYLDGAPLTSAAHGIVSLADLPATAIERIEVYRSITPLSWGPAAPGGAINLVTAGAPPGVTLHSAHGSFGTWEARGTAGLARGPLAGLVHAGYQGSEGDFRYPDDNATPFNPDDDALGTRLNNRFDALSTLARVRWTPGRLGSLTLREDLFRKGQGVPGLGVAPALHPHLGFTRSITQLDAETGPLPSGLRAYARGTLQRSRSRFTDREGTLGLGRHASDDRLQSDDAALRLAWDDLPLGLAAEGSAGGREERARLHDDADGLPDPPRSARATRGAGVVLRWSGWDGRVLLHAARRWDRVRDRIRGLSPTGMPVALDVARTLDAPQLGARVAVGPLELLGNWTEAARPPEFLELFGNQGSVLGNVSLRPETMRRWDAGGRVTLARAGRTLATLEAAHFDGRATDLIAYIRNSQQSVRPVNVSRARVWGEELSLRAGPWRGLAFSGAFTRQESRDQGAIKAWNGKRLPQRPARRGFARLEWRAGRFTASAEVDYLGDNYRDPYNSDHLASRTLTAAALGFTPWPWTRLTIEGRNLGDRHVSDVGGFPLPGRSVFVSLDVRLGVARDPLGAAAAERPLGAAAPDSTGGTP